MFVSLFKKITNNEKILKKQKSFGKKVEYATLKRYLRIKTLFDFFKRYNLEFKFVQCVTQRVKSIIQIFFGP